MLLPYYLRLVRGFTVGFIAFISITINLSLATLAHAAPAANSTFKGMVVTIHPLYLIASAITKGVEQPVRLLDPSVDGHSVQLTPKQAYTLQNANFILWMGPNFEGTIATAIGKSGNADNAVAVSKYISNPYPARNLMAGKLAVKASADGHSHATVNPHLWLDPNKAIAIARLIAHTRSLQYPHYQPLYMANLAQFTQRMQQAVLAVRTSRTELLGTDPIAYVSYVDVYQALESSLGLSLVGSYTYEDVAMTPNHLQWLNQTFASTPIGCIAVSPAVGTSLATPPSIAKAIVNENLSQHTDFVTGFSSIARQFIHCAADTSKRKSKP